MPAVGGVMTDEKEERRPVRVVEDTPGRGVVHFADLISADGKHARTLCNPDGVQVRHIVTGSNPTSRFTPRCEVCAGKLDRWTL